MPIQDTTSPKTSRAALSEVELMDLARRGDAEAARRIVERHNLALYRTARAVLQDESEAEDVVQEAYVRAFTTAAAFRGDCSLSTWLTRIALNEAVGRLRRSRPTVDVAKLDLAAERDRMQVIPFPVMTAHPDPEQSAARREIRRVLERAIDELPEPFRVVFVLREVEELSVEETAAQLGLRAETVRTRLHRARRLLRTALHSEVASALSELFPFGGARCARTTEAVLHRLAALKASN
jgi:RNA polymerase sigma-70 factor (ECF subfamily)